MTSLPSDRPVRRRSGALAGLVACSALACSSAAGPYKASVSGRALFEGAPPASPVVRMGRDPVCERAHPAGVPAETPVVSPEGGLADVLVYAVGRLPKGFRSVVPTDPVVLDQLGCRFLPHVAAVRVGQELEIRNSDATVHRVEARTEANTAFSESMAGAGLVVRKTFTAPEVAVRLKCPLHPWMSARVGVFDHPFFAVTAADGSFRIEGLPEGEYTLHAWHETLGQRSVAIEVDDGDDALSVDFPFAGN